MYVAGKTEKLGNCFLLKAAYDVIDRLYAFVVPSDKAALSRRSITAAKEELV